MPQKKIENPNLEDIKAWTPESEPEMKDTYEWLDERIDSQLKNSRKDIFGKDIDGLWDDIDRAYVPHRLSAENTGNEITYVTDDDQGWLSRSVKLGETDWQSDIASNDFYTKIQTALSVLIERNPEGVFIPKAKKFEKNTQIAYQLYKNSWQQARSRKRFLLPFVFNLIKYGWSIGRTYPRMDAEFEGTYREAINPKRAWIDDMAKADDQDSARDWCWDVDYGYDVFKRKYPDDKYSNSKFVMPKKAPSDKSSLTEKTFKEKNVVTCTFYENKERDIFAMRANGVWIFVDQLPIWAESDMKKLSCSWAYCTMRHPDTPFGIGLIEAMKESKVLKDKLLNMTIDQLVLSIYKMFFYSGTDLMDGSGKIKIEPGVGRQIDSKDISWLEVPGPGAEAWNGIDRVDEMLEKDSGVTKQVEGDTSGKQTTLGEVFQAKEAALKRLKIPLWGITDALDNEAYLTLHVNEMIYSVPEVIELTDESKIRDYMQEINSDPELFQRDFNEETGEEKFYAKRYPEVYANLETNEEGSVIETEDSRFFRIKPSGLMWDGMIFIKSQSILEHTKELDKQMKLEMSNLLMPLIQRFVNGEFYLEKPIRQILKIYDESWDDWMPTAEDAQMFRQQQAQKQIMEQQIAQGGSPQGSPQASQPERVVSQASIGAQPQQNTGSILNRITGGIRNMFNQGQK